jgi:hypothetical protein
MVLKILGGSQSIEVNTTPHIPSMSFSEKKRRNTHYLFNHEYRVFNPKKM